MTAPLTPERLAELAAKIDMRALTRQDASDLLAALDAAEERAKAAEAEAKAVRIDRQLLLDERVEVGALRAALNTEEMEPYRDLAHHGKQAHRLGETRKKLEAAEAALARVEALADAFESPGGGYRGVAIAIREALEGKP